MVLLIGDKGRGRHRKELASVQPQALSGNYRVSPICDLVFAVIAGDLHTKVLIDIKSKRLLRDVFQRIHQDLGRYANLCLCLSPQWSGEPSSRFKGR